MAHFIIIISLKLASFLAKFIYGLKNPYNMDVDAQNIEMKKIMFDSINVYFVAKILNFLKLCVILVVIK